MKTIRQIAEEIGVSKQAVHQKRKSKELSTCLQPFTSTVDGVVYIDEPGETLILQAFNKSPSTSFTAVDVNEPSTVYGHVDGQIIEILREQLATKDVQINELNERLKEQTAANKDLTAALEHTTASLHAAQALHAGTMQKHLTDNSPVEVINEAGQSESPPVKKKGFWNIFKKQ
jgi:hypothetical protein